MNTTVVIPESVYIGYIIGFGGRTIRYIEEESKTNIRSPSKSNPVDRTFTIYGFGGDAATDVDKAVNEILQLVNGRLVSKGLAPMEKDQLILSMAHDDAPERQVALVASQKRYVSDDDFIEILRWLRRYDLDGVQITSRKLRSLVENNQMPRRHLSRFRFGAGETSGNLSLMVIPNRHHLGFDIDVDRAVGYLSYAFIEEFIIDTFTKDDDDLPILQSQELLTAPDEHIKEVRIASGTSTAIFRQAGLLEETICVCSFDQLAVQASDMPDWQISDDFLRRLGRIGCVKVDLSALFSASSDSENFIATDDGLLDYCFSPDLGALGSRERTLWIMAGVSIGPTFFRKCIEAHFASPVTTKMELELHKGDPVRYDVRGFLEHLAEYAVYRHDSETEIRYDIPDQGDGMRLLVGSRAVSCIG